jgi:hypothetical protein
METVIHRIVCPNCRTTIAESIRHNGLRAGSTIGPSVVSCPDCGTCCCTGNSEWDEKSLFQRLWFLFNRTLWWLIGSLFVAGFAAIVTGWILVEWRLIHPRKLNEFRLIAFVVGAALIGMLLARNTLSEIRTSRQRVRDSSPP